MTKSEMTKRWLVNTPESERQIDIWLASNRALASIFVLAFLIIGIFAPLRPLDGPVPLAMTDLSAAAQLPAGR